jgi:hypothetical protein
MCDQWTPGQPPPGQTCPKSYQGLPRSLSGQIHSRDTYLVDNNRRKEKRADKPFDVLFRQLMSPNSDACSMNF